MRSKTGRSMTGLGLTALVILGALLFVGFTWVFPPVETSADAPSAASVDAPEVEASATAASAEVDAGPAPRPLPPPLENLDAQPTTREAQHEALFSALAAHYALDDAAMRAIRDVFAGSRRIGQGDPSATEHPMTKRQCLAIREEAKIVPDAPRCGSRYMVPIYDPGRGETADTANQCIDQFEFPGIPCEYPVTWVTAREAALLCKAVGKRMCDAHEWEGACAGAVLPVTQEYHFDQARKYAKAKHNQEREKVWAYGPEKDHKKCATGSKKNDKCGNGGKCGSNTYPAGAFPACVSKLGVYDLHGNAAEHMNLPLAEDQLMSKGGSGETEMKGSWFIFQSYEAHEDDCRWRAPDWHVSGVMDVNSHANYHLGFRCCKDLDAAPL